VILTAVSRRDRRRRLAGAALLVGALLALPACDGGDDEATTTVAVELGDYEITARPTVPAGRVTFEIANEGGVAHEVEVVRTDLDPSDFPTLPDGSANESSFEIVDEVNVPAGRSATMRVELDAGKYVLLCNLAPDAAADTPAHYAEGMFSSLVVE
jgi:uncharacterized cupredoxin-like copper-binding protein